MATMACDVCGGKVVSSAKEGWFECENCGTEYPLEWMKAKFQKTQTVKLDGEVKVEGAVTVESLYKRACLLLEDKNWKQADEILDDVLKIDPEYAPAYIGKLCAALKVSKEEKLANAYAVRVTVLRCICIPHSNNWNSYLAGRKFNLDDEIVANTELKHSDVKYVWELIGDGVDLTNMPLELSQAPLLEKALRFADVGYKSKLESYLVQYNANVTQYNAGVTKLEKALRQRDDELKKIIQWRKEGKCRFCGGKLRGLLQKQCTVCREYQ